MATKLSICVPSRNRQESFCHTICGLIANPREDVEFIFVDNSDNPDVMNTFMAGLSDPRIRYVPSDGVVYSMRDNWERAMVASTGDWITFIGDDDHVEPDVMDLIQRITVRAPQIEVIGWARITYSWPELRLYGKGFFVSMGNEIHPMPKASMIRRMFLWEGSTHVPACPFTIYHGAVSRIAMERLRQKFCGRYFEHPIVDYDNAFKLLFSAQALAYIDRPMSVLGVSAKSNSAAVGQFDKAVENYSQFVSENGDDYEKNRYLEGFPFGTTLGVASAILAAQQWFKAKYNAPLEGWEQGFAKALMLECGHADSQKSHDTQVALCRIAFDQWKGGQYSEYFQPHYIERDLTPGKPILTLENGPPISRIKPDIKRGNVGWQVGGCQYWFSKQGPVLQIGVLVNETEKVAGLFKPVENKRAIKARAVNGCGLAGSALACFDVLIQTRPIMRYGLCLRQCVFNQSGAE